VARRGEERSTVGRSTVLEPPDVELVTASALEPIRKVQLYEQISERIIERIRLGAWSAGQRLPAERELARLFGVSRPSLREALGALQMVGVVETHHGSGTWVSKDALEVLAQRPGADAVDFGVSPVALLEARAHLEPTIASLATPRFTRDPEMERLLEMMDEARDWENPVHRAIWSDADRLFHRQIAVHTDNSVFLAVADHIARVMSEPLWRRLRDDMLAAPGRIAASVDEHERIFEAIREGRPDDAFAHASRHVEVVREYMGLE
jgi:DNA-binding FadR family transcriptional regulator